MMKPFLPRPLLLIAVVAACARPAAGFAQSIAYGDVAGGDASVSSGPSGDSGDISGSRHGHGKAHRRVEIAPYIEAAQVVTAEFSPQHDVLTYTQVAVGVDASVQGRRNAGSVSLRYEREIGETRNAPDGDLISGIARGYATVVPGVEVEAGGLAARTRADGTGRAALGQFGQIGNSSQMYSVYAGPTVATHLGAAAVNADYRFGYTKLDAPKVNGAPPAVAPGDVFDESTLHSASAHIGFRPHEALPIGVGAGAGYNREDISNLDQRVEDFAARGDVTIPVTRTLALVGGAGYEKVKVSGRDALRDANGNPVIDSRGRFVTDQSAPRIIAYETDGLIWDAGVVWRPSTRTALEAHYGRRYGSYAYYGSFAYAPSRRSSINISVYDSLGGFGGQINRALVDLPTDFEALRNPLNGDISGCVVSLEKGSCLNGALGSVRSAVFRSRGVMATYAVDFGRLQAGIGGGYDWRKFIAPRGSVLALANGVVDQNYWLDAYLSSRLDQRSGIRAQLYADWFQSGSSSLGDATSVGAVASYYHLLTEHLSATAALGVDGLQQKNPLPDFWSASALLGVNYSF
jgi:hypothetical protein